MGEVVLVKQLVHCIIINLKLYHRTGKVHDGLMGKLFRSCHMLMEGTNPYIDSKCVFFLMSFVLPDDFFHYPLSVLLSNGKPESFCCYCFLSYQDYQHSLLMQLVFTSSTFIVYVQIETF